MKLLFYSHAFSPQIGGVETFAMHLACGLAQRNHGGGATPAHVVTVVTQTAGVRQPEVPEAPFHIIRRPGGRRLWQLIGSADKVVLAGPAILPLFFALIRRKPVMVTHHGYQSICPNGLLFYVPTQNRCSGHFAARRYLECVRCNAPEQMLMGSIRNLLLTFLRRGLCWFANSNVAVSNHVARRIALPHAQVIRNGVPVMPQMDSRSNTSKSRTCFAYVGRLVTEKGVATLLDAARLLKARRCRFHLIIVGDGPERGPLQKLVSGASLDDEVSFAGFQTGSQLQELLTDVSAIVVPSIWEEAAPLSPLEQMMQSRFIIASDLGGLAEQIDDAGLRFEAGNSAALADQMQSVIDDPRSVTRFECRARERALNLYSLDRMLQEYRTLLQRL
jgi:glycosyltransferase involved in cell wall biosynthesis